jgi:hypothetical protein
MFTFLIRTALRAAGAVARLARSVARRVRRCLRGLASAHLRLSRAQPVYLTTVSTVTAALVGELRIEEFLLVLLTAGFTLAGPSTAAAGVRPEPCRDWSWSRLLFSRRRSLEAMSSEQPAGSPEVHPNAFLRALLTIRPGDGERAREGSPATGGRRQPGRPGAEPYGE